jgi:hypothetical protein
VRRCAVVTKIDAVRQRDGQQTGRWTAAFSRRCARNLTLACFEAGVALANHEHLAAPAHDFAIAVPLLGGLQG